MPRFYQHLLFTLPLLVSALASPAAVTDPSENEPPLHVTADSRIWKNVLAEHLAWCERTLIQPYLERNKANPSTPQELAFIRAALSGMVEKPEQEDDPEIFGQPREAVVGKSNDPLVSFAWAFVQTQQSDLIGASATLDAALPLAQGLSGPKTLAWVIERESIVKSLSPVTELGADAPMVTLTRDVIHDGSFAGGEYDIFARLFLGEKMKKYRDLNQSLYAPLVDSSDLPLWIRETMRGQMEVVKAWQMRGDGFAPSVSKEAWIAFADHLKQAREALIKSNQLEPSNPLAATEMITVVMGGAGQDNETERDWFDRAIQAQFDFFPAYCHLLWAYRPRWGGSTEKMIAFGEACAATHRMDTVVPEIFFQATTNVVEEEQVPWKDLFRGNSAVSALMVSLSKERVEEPSRKNRQEINLALLAVNAFLAGDFVTANAARSHFHDRLPDVASNKLDTFDLSDTDLKSATKLAGEAGGGEYSAAEKYLQQGSADSALVALEAALEKVAPERREIVQTRLDGVALHVGFASGNWVKLDLNAARPCWFFGQAPEDTWFYSPKDLRAPSRMQKLDLDLGDNLEARGNFSLPEKLSATSVFAIELGNRKPNYYTPGWILCRITTTIAPGVFAVSIRNSSGRPLVPDVTLPLEKINKILLRLQNGRFSLNLNDQVIGSDIPVPIHSEGFPEVIFGFANQPAVDAAATEWEIRKLPPAEPVPDAPPGEASEVLKT